MIDLSKTVGNDGLTLQDLVVSLLQELGKHGYMCSGAIIDVKDPQRARVFGHGNPEAMKAVLSLGQVYLERGDIDSMEKFQQGGN